MKLLLFIAFIFSLGFSQRPLGIAAESNAAGNSDFDFWLGTWDLMWNDTSRGTNVITKELNGFVIQEHFNDPASAFTGRSWTVYDTAGHTWKQTWVDNRGGYILLSGKFEGGRMILKTQAVERKGQKIISRMVFYNISNDSFDWNWEHSTDGGSRWTLAWKIHYQRRK